MTSQFFWTRSANSPKNRTKSWFLAITLVFLVRFRWKCEWKVIADNNKLSDSQNGQKLKFWVNLNIFIPNNDNVILKSKLFSLMNSIHTASIPIYQLSEIILAHKRPLVCLSILGRYSIGTSDKPLSVNLRLKDWSKKGSRCRSEQRIVFPLLGLILRWPSIDINDSQYERVPY